MLYALAGLALAVTVQMPGPPRRHEALLLALVGLAVAAAPVAYLIQRDGRSPTWLLHVVQSFALIMVAVVVACSDGDNSP